MKLESAEILQEVHDYPIAKKKADEEEPKPKECEPKGKEKEV